jgi:hypothetical protein
VREWRMRSWRLGWGAHGEEWGPVGECAHPQRAAIVGGYSWVRCS